MNNSGEEKSQERSNLPKRWFDSLIRSIAAGLSLHELRLILRGEPTSERPNPRYRAQVISFLLHIRPRFYYRASTFFSHTFRLGFFTTFCFFVEGLTGIILMIYYVPTPESAYSSIQRIMGEIPFGELIRDIHRFAAEAMVVLAILHMVRTFITGSFKNERKFTWLTGVLLLVLTLGMAFSGYLLPWDQLAYWAVTIGTSMVEAVPFIGDSLNFILRGSKEIGADGLLRFYLLHVILLPVLLLTVFGAHYYRIARTHNISLPVRFVEGELSESERAKAYEKVNLIPDVLYHEVFLILLGLLILIVVSHFFYDAPLEHHADPTHTPVATQAPWFFLWVQGLLKFGDKTLMGVIIPILVFLLLFAVPYIDRTPFRSLRRRPFALPLAGIMIVSLVWFSYTGTAGYGIQMPVAIQIGEEFLPEEGIGLIHKASFDSLKPGVFIVGEMEKSPFSEDFKIIVNEMEKRIQAAATSGDFPDAQALIIIEEEQINLKRITLRINWIDPSGEAKTYERITFVHRNRKVSPTLIDVKRVEQ